MTRVVLDIDDGVLARANELAQARGISIAELVEMRLSDVAGLVPLQLENSSHRAIMAELDRPEMSGRDALHDRPRLRAEDYARRRQELLDLIDATQGDMGAYGWNRSRAYEP